MPEVKKVWLEREVNYQCDTGDGGLLFYDEDPKLNNQGEQVFLHRCTSPKDKDLYFFKTKYPRIELIAINTSGIEI